MWWDENGFLAVKKEYPDYFVNGFPADTIVLKACDESMRDHWFDAEAVKESFGNSQTFIWKKEAAQIVLQAPLKLYGGKSEKQKRDHFWKFPAIYVKVDQEAEHVIDKLAKEYKNYAKPKTVLVINFMRHDFQDLPFERLAVSTIESQAVKTI